MMKVPLSFLCCLVGVMLLPVGCQDVPTIEIAKLEGKWVVYSAKRNRKLTTTLNDAYFFFKENNKLLTNIMGEDEESSYSLSGDVIQLDNSDGHKYNIANLTDDTLILKTKIQNFYFEFSMLRESADSIHNHFDHLQDGHDLSSDSDSD